MARLATALKAYQKNPATLALATSKLGAAPKPAPGAPAKGLPAPVKIPVAAPTTPLPWDANYESTIGGINRDEANSLSGLANEETGVRQQYGFDDVSDPFNRLKMLQEAFANRQRGSTNSFAAQGQAFSSAYENQKGADQHGYDSDYNGLRRDYATALGDITARRTAVKNQAADDTTAADWERTQAALAARPDAASVPVATTTSAGTPIKGAGAATAKDYTERPVKGGVWHDYKDGRKSVFVKKG